ncbi:MAG: hypothetical protein A2148_10005 [Chloroflexi bacterium RBG_16_68_14]|nr:MAG: hypothetical protein A2148_10005 [Chloroflexi bacterium RBG_16_68_14]
MLDKNYPPFAAVADLARGQARLLRLVVAAGCLFLVFYTVALIVIPSELYLGIHSNVLYNVPPMAALGLAIFPIRRSRGRERLGWLCLAFLLLTWEIGEWTYSYYDLVLDTETPFPGYADIAYYAGYIAFIAAIPLLVFPKERLEDRRWIIDALIVMAIAGVVSWEYILEPTVTSSGYSALYELIALGYPLLDIGLLTALVVTLYASGGRFSWRSLVLVGATLASIVADGIYTYAVATTGYDNVGNPLELGWLLAYVLLGICFVLPDERPQEAAPPRPSSVGLVLPYAAILLASGLAIGGAVWGSPSPVLIGGAIAVVPLVFLRQLLTLRENSTLNRRLRREAGVQRAQGRVLEMVASGAPLHDTLDELVRMVERQTEGMLCSICLISDDGTKLLPAAALGLPVALTNAIADGIPIGPQAGSCGTAAYRKEPVVVSDIAVDPLWAGFREVALSNGIRACWSTPIFSPTGGVLGTLAMYYGEPRAPGEEERQLIDTVTHLAGIAIEHDTAEASLRESQARLRLLNEQAPAVLWAVDRELRFTSSLGTGLKTLGLQPNQVIGVTLFEYFQTDDPGFRPIAAHRRALRGESVRYEGAWAERVFDCQVEPLRDAEANIIGVIGVATDITERKGMEEALREQTRRDPLTGALNHAGIIEELRLCISNGNRGFAMAMVDVDGLKAVNDTYGHQLGDAVLVAVANALSQDGATVGRYGGDEFIVLLPDTDRAGAERYRSAILDVLARATLSDPEARATVPVVASVGLAVYPDEAGGIAELIELSDNAMYVAKRQRPTTPEDLSGARSLDDDQAAKLVGEIVPFLTAPGDANEKLRLVAHRLSVGAGYDGVNIEVFWPDRRAPPTSQDAFAEAPDELMQAWNQEQRERVGHPIGDILERTLRPIIMNDLEHDELLTDLQRELLRGAGIKSGLVAPMVWEGRLVGTLSVGSKRLGAFTPKDAQFVMTVATQMTAITRMGTLMEQLQHSSNSLVRAHEETVLLLAAAAEVHDRSTGRHLHSMRMVAEHLALELGYGGEDAGRIGLAAVLHDIGKMQVPEAVLSWPGKLADSEWRVMQQHTVWGAEFLAGHPGFELAAAIARSHHEHWDGSGYPDGLAGDEIPGVAAITTVADAFDAMVSGRPYRKPRSVVAAVREIVAFSGKQFSPKVVEALVRLHQRKVLTRLRRALADDRAAA